MPKTAELLWMCVLALPFRLSAEETTAPDSSCAAYHVSFDDFSFLNDDYSARFAEPTLEHRNLKLVPGRFGQALLNENAFSPADFEKTYLSTRDLDLLLEVLCFHRFKYDQLRIGGRDPYFWGTGRVKMDGGTVAFWAKGAPAYPGYLFFQGSSSFGRLEKDLLAIRLNEDRSISALLVDARYHRHTIASASLWKNDVFNHVALAWDRAQGLVLYLNGQIVASSWGKDAWWTTQMPGLFHLPMCGVTCDELWILDRPASMAEILRLMQHNKPPNGPSRLEPMDADAIRRLRQAFLGTGRPELPTVTPTPDDRRLCFHEVFPVSAGDGCVQAPALMDGRCEMAWPMGYTSFTNILGDSDFQPEKVDFVLPPGAGVNCITMEGNLNDAKVLAGKVVDAASMREVTAVPRDGRFFHEAIIEPHRDVDFRIPFVKEYGSPPGYKNGLHLPLTGDIRLHEVGFFEVSSEANSTNRVSGQLLHIRGEGRLPDDGRYGYAMRAMNDRRNAAILSLTTKSGGSTYWRSVPAMTRFNLLSEPFNHPLAVKAIDLDLNLRGIRADTFAFLRLHHPGLPARIWTSAVFQLKEFPASQAPLRVRLDITDIKAGSGDRLWLDLTLGEDAELEVGGQSSSRLRVETGPLSEADPQYARKALQPALASFTKIYYWYYPWILTGTRPDPDHPLTFGGYYDIVNNPPMVLRTEPDQFLARALTELSLVNHDVKPAFTFDAWENAPHYWPPPDVAHTDDSPDWAFYMNHYLTRFTEIVHWWADRQNADGQVGGGWNDDCVFSSRISGPLLYLGDTKARRMFNRVIAGYERTGLDRDGYCPIVPIDSMHAEDRVRHRYEGLLFEPGGPFKMKLAMRTARRFGKPELTPVNYFDGRPFKYDRDLLLWYWGRLPEYPAYATTREQVTARMKELAPAMNDVIRFRYTQAGMFTDGAYMPGCYDVKRMVLGGGWGPFLDELTLAACWEDGRGPTIPRWIEHASSTDLVAHLYSYENTDVNVTVRLYRIKPGIYRVTLAGEGKDAASGALYQKEVELRRFSKVTVPLPPRREMILKIERTRELPESGPLPDLAVDKVSTANGRVRAEVLNFGLAPVGPFTVRLENSAGKTLGEQQIHGLDPTVDFIPAVTCVEFSLDHPLPEGRLVVNPDRAIPEITEENNALPVPP